MKKFNFNVIFFIAFTLNSFSYAQNEPCRVRTNENNY